MNRDSGRYRLSFHKFKQFCHWTSGSESRFFSFFSFWPQLRLGPKLGAEGPNWSSWVIRRLLGRSGSQPFRALLLRRALFPPFPFHCPFDMIPGLQVMCLLLLPFPGLSCFVVVLSELRSQVCCLGLALWHFFLIASLPFPPELFWRLSTLLLD
jgi:hypothetical protein